jgi:hypothetical protein
MNLRLSIRLLFCFVAMMPGRFALYAAPLKLPVNAIEDDTFLVMRVDLTKADSAAAAATLKAALGTHEGDIDDFLGFYKTHYERYVDKGAESVTVVLRGDFMEERGPEYAFYVKFKPGADQAAVEKRIRAEERDDKTDVQDVAHEGDFIVLRKQGGERRVAGSEGRAKLFADALGDSDKSVVGALIFNESIVKGIVARLVKYENATGLGTLAKDCKWFRFEMTLGEMAQMEVTMQAADQVAGTHVADAVAGLGDLMRAALVRLKQRAAKLPALVVAKHRLQVEWYEAAAMMSEAFKPRQAGSRVACTADVKAVGGVLRLISVGRETEAAQAPASKSGL